MDNKGDLKKGIITAFLAITVMILAVVVVTATSNFTPVLNDTTFDEDTTTNITFSITNSEAVPGPNISGISIVASSLGGFTINAVNFTTNSTTVLTTANSATQWNFTNTTVSAILNGTHGLNLSLSNVTATRPGTYNFTIYTNYTDASSTGWQNNTNVTTTINDNTTPSLETYPASLADTKYVSGTLNLNATITDQEWWNASNLTSVKYWINMTNVSTATITYNGTDNTSHGFWNANYSWITSSLTDGDVYNFTLEVTDTASNAGNLTSAANVLSAWTVDNVGPTYTFMNYTNNTNSSNAVETFQLRVADAVSGIRNETVYIAFYNGSHFYNDTGDVNTSTGATSIWTQLNNDSACAAGGSCDYNQTINTTALPDGHYWIYVWANDSISLGYGNNNTGTSTTYYITADDTAPAFSAWGAPTEADHVDGDSQAFVVNGTFTDSGTGINAVWFVWDNNKTGNFTDTAIASSGTTYYGDYSLNLTLMDTQGYNVSEGAHNVTVYSNDTMGLISSASTVLNITLDGTAPAVAFLAGSYTANDNFTTTDTTNVVNMSVTDTSAGINNKSFNYAYTNDSGSNFYKVDGSAGWTQLDNAGSCNNASTSTCYFNWSFSAAGGLVDGHYNVTVNVSDFIDVGTANINNSHSTVYRTFTVDQTDPVAGVSLSASSITSGASVTITNTGTDATSGVAAKTATVLTPLSVTDTVTLVAGAGTYVPNDGLGTYTITTAVTDYASNSHTASTTLTVTSSGTSGGAGGGGSITTPTVEPKETTSWSAMVPGTTYDKTMGADLAVGVKIAVKAAASDVKLDITKLAAKPAEAAAPSGKAYKYFNFAMRNLEDANIETAAVTFDVDNSWITTNNIDKATIKLNRYVGTEWVALETELVEEGETVTTFKATTPGFSYFVITGEEAEAPVGPAEEVNIWWWIVGIVIIAAIAVGLYFVFKKPAKKG